MKRKPSTEATGAWIRLMRVQSRVLDAVEQDLKKAGFPPLAWYDALLELSRAPSGEMRPVELEKQMLIPQYSTSRLIDRLVDEGLAARRECKIDKRGQFVEITEAGRELQKKMWTAYSAAIEKHVGAKLSDADAAKLSGLLDRQEYARMRIPQQHRGQRTMQRQIGGGDLDVPLAVYALAVHERALQT